MTKLIVFDVWGTMLHRSAESPSFGDLRRTLGLKQMQSKEFITAFEKAVQQKKYQERKEFAMDLCRKLKIPLSQNNIELIERWDISREKGVQLFEGYPDVLIALKKSYKLAILSNLTNFSAQIIFDLNLNKYFDYLFLSFELGMIKPQPELFKYVEKEVNVRPQDILFIDDNPSNIQAAGNCGWEGIVFTDMESLRTCLNKKKVLLN